MKKKQCLFFRIYLFILLVMSMANIDSIAVKEYAQSWKTIAGSAIKYQNIAFITIQKTLFYSL